MLTFYRKIRKSLIESGMMRRYLFYAVGEIALVVIGILIALQANNWNQLRLQKLEEKNVLRAISKDMDRMQDYCRVCGQAQQSILNASQRLLNIMHGTAYPRAEDGIEQDLSLLFVRCFVGEGLSENIYDVLMGSGQMELLSSKELRYELGYLDSWIGTLIPYDRRQAEFVDAQLKPLINQYVDRTRFVLNSPSSQTTIDTTGFERRFDASYRELLEDREFSNLLVDLMIHTNGVKGMYAFMDLTIGQIDSILIQEMPELEPEIDARSKLQRD